jgi:hypothetical protein
MNDFSDDEQAAISVARSISDPALGPADLRYLRPTEDRFITMVFGGERTFYCNKTPVRRCQSLLTTAALMVNGD